MGQLLQFVKPLVMGTVRRTNSSWTAPQKHVAVARCDMINGRFCLVRIAVDETELVSQDVVSRRTVVLCQMPALHLKATKTCLTKQLHDY